MGSKNVRRIIEAEPRVTIPNNRSRKMKHENVKRTHFATRDSNIINKYKL